MKIRTAQTTDEVDRNEQHNESTLVRGRIPTESFALEETFAAVPDLTVECAPLVASGEAANMSLLWANTDDTDLTATLRRDPTVSTVTELRRTDDRRLYRVEWTHDIRCCIDMLLQSEGILLSNRGTETEWTVEILYPNREDVRTANECCEQYGLSFAIDTIRSLDSERTTQCGLTPAQYDILTQACQSGYFTVPRETGLEELSNKMNVSHQALSERLRRGHDTLIKSTLIETSSVPPTVSSPTLSL